MQAVEKEFAKGAAAYMVEKCSDTNQAGSPHSEWHKHRGTVKSSGKKYVTVTGFGAQRRFVASDKPILASEKGCAFLVSTEERADTLVRKLSESTAS